MSDCNDTGGVALSVVAVESQIRWQAPPAVTIHLYGRDARGASVLVRAHGFRPFFYVRANAALLSAVDAPADASAADALEAVRRALVVVLRRADIAQARAEDCDRRARGIAWHADDASRERVARVTRVAGDRFSIFGFDEEPVAGLLRVEVALPFAIRSKRPKTAAEARRFPEVGGLRDAVSTGALASLADVFALGDNGDGNGGGGDGDEDDAPDIDIDAAWGLEPDVFDSEFGAELQFMVETGIRGGGTFVATHDPQQAAEAAEATTYEPGTGVDCVIDCRWDTLVAPAPASFVPAPERILSFDIEVRGTPDRFPSGDRDQSMMIACCTAAADVSEAEIAQRDPASPRVDRVIFCAGAVGSVAGTRVECFDNEAEMLLAFAQYMCDADPDVVTGWNIEDFDLKFLVDRVVEAGAADDAARTWGRLHAAPTSNYAQVFESSAFGRRESNRAAIPGRVVADGLEQWRRNFNLRSYKLDAVAAGELGEGKDDVHFTEITPLWDSGDLDKRARLAKYCVADAELVLRLFAKKQIWTNLRELSFVAGVPPQVTVSRGQSVRVETLMATAARARGFVFPFVPRAGDPAFAPGPDHPLTGLTAREIRTRALGEGEIAGAASRARVVGFEGATVVEPVKGFYEEPVAVLDFEGLYPSIMRAHNLCFSTRLAPETGRVWLETRPADVVETPTGAFFAVEGRRRGLLPEILADLYTARKNAKRAMAEAFGAGDMVRRANFNGRQLALKVTSNSIYGFTGATTSKWYMTDISASVTAYGREGIETSTARTLEFNPRYEVVYGDTDSIMVRLDMKDFADRFEKGDDGSLSQTCLRVVLREAIARAQALNAFVNKAFKRPINLEFEKIFWPFLLLRKKRYAAMHYETEDPAEGFLDIKGLEATRRDNALVVSETVRDTLATLFGAGGRVGAVTLARGVAEAVARGEMPHERLVVSKAYTRTDYFAKQPHAELVDRMKRRGEHTFHVALGDRVPFVITMGARDVIGAMSSTAAAGVLPLTCLRAEDPEYVARMGLQIDSLYYLEQLIKTVGRVLKCVCGSQEEVIRQVFGILKTYRAPRRGILPRRFQPLVVRALFAEGNTAALINRRVPGSAALPAAPPVSGSRQQTIGAFFSPTQ